MPSFQELIKLIVNGDPVDATTINTTLQQLDGNTRYLRDLFEAAALGSTVFAREVTVESGAALGMPVYYNSTNQQFERALAQAATDAEGKLVTADSGQVWGVVHYKHSSTKADLLLHGYTALDISAAVDSGPTAGLYHLSGTEAGKMTQQKPPVSVGVLQHDGNGNVYVNPNFSDVLWEHQHYRYELIADAAGTPNSPDVASSLGATATVTITDFTELNTGDKVNLIATDGTNYDFVNGSQSSVNGTWESDGSNDQTATNLMNVINTSSGPSGTRFSATVLGAVVTITQTTVGPSGNTTVTLTDSGTAGMTSTDFVGGVGAPHTITAPDSTVEGWLPASDAVFGGNAPSGAVFGYNISKSTLNDVWPPLPAENAVLEHTRPRNVTYGATTTGTYTTNTVPDDVCVIDRNGIWWMTDCYGEVPWHSGDIVSTASLTCAPDTHIVLWFSKMQFQTSGTVVTSLRAKSGSGLTLKCAFDTNDDAISGDLEIDLDLSLLVDSGDDEVGYLAIKRFADNTFYRGPVVEAIKSGTGGIAITSTAEDLTLSQHQGIVTISLTNAGVGNEFPIEMIRLSGATEENYNDVLAVGLPANCDAEYRAKFNVPANLPTGSTVNVAIRFQILMRIAGNVPTLTLTGRVIGRSAGTSLALPSADSVVVLDVSGVPSMVLDNYIEIESATIATSPGDSVLFTLSRAGSSDGLAGEVHIIDQRAVVASIT